MAAVIAGKRLLTPYCRCLVDRAVHADQRRVGRALFARQDSAVTVEQDQGRVELHLERLLDRARAPLGGDEHGIIDAQLLGRLGRARLSFLGRRAGSHAMPTTWNRLPASSSWSSIK